MALADVVRASDSDLEWLYPHRSVEDTAAAWLDSGPAMVVATYGSAGPWGLVKAGTARAKAPVVDVADTVGAGDSFISAMLSALEVRGLLGSAQREALHKLDTATLGEILGLCGQGRGHHRLAARREPADPGRDFLAAAKGQGDWNWMFGWSPATWTEPSFARTGRFPRAPSRRSGGPARRECTLFSSPAGRCAGWTRSARPSATWAP